MRLGVMLVTLLAVLALAIPMVASRTARLPFAVPMAGTAVLAGRSDPPPRGESVEWPPRIAPTGDVASTAPLPTAGRVIGKPTFSILDRSTGQLTSIDALTYVRGALASEMPPTFHAEALAAQAVAAHTWALYCVRWEQEHPDPSLHGADFSADPAKDEGYLTEARIRERYGESFGLYWPKICAAADYAMTHVLTYDEQPILAAYHSMSAGQTESADRVWTASVPYLTPVTSEGDALAPDYRVQSVFDPTTLHDRLQSAFPRAELDTADPAHWMIPLERSPGGYVTRVSVGGQTVDGKDVRTALGLRSTCFTVAYANHMVTIETTGYGHGVGLSQYGADFMGRQGATCPQILAHYYPGTTLSEVHS